MTPWREDLYGELGDRAVAWLIGENDYPFGLKGAWLVQRLRSVP